VGVGEPVDHRVGVVAQGYKAPKRYELGGNDIRAPEVDAKGEVKNPWQRTAWLVVVNPGTKDGVRFKAMQGRFGLSDLAGGCGWRSGS
jgi:hypothetical protein